MSKKPAKPDTKIAELYGLPTLADHDWKAVTQAQTCPYLDAKCVKNRKSEPSITFGTCTMAHGENNAPILICPVRLLERSQVFLDCIRLLKNHEQGNELRIVGELGVPGGSVDYCLASVRDGKAKDFVGIELQTLDTTGTVWPERQRFLRAHGIKVKDKDANSQKPYGMNWKMSAKTILMQLHHKIATFENLCKHLVLVLQDCLLAYMRREFAFSHIKAPKDGDAMRFHSYRLKQDRTGYRLEFDEAVSTDAAGIATCLGLQADAKVELDAMFALINARLPTSTLLEIGGSIPVPASVDAEADEES